MVFVSLSLAVYGLSHFQYLSLSVRLLCIQFVYFFLLFIPPAVYGPHVSQQFHKVA